MKTNLLSTMLLASMLFFFTNSKAQTRLLHYWHFNNVPSGVHLGTGKLVSDYTKAGITGAYLRNVKIAGTVQDTGYWDNGTPGDTTNQRPGFGGCCTGTNAFIRTRNPNDSMQFLWYIPTTNFKNIVIKYTSQSSSTGSGPARQRYEYSLDSGATYITTGLPRLFDSAGTSFGRVVLNLSGISTINNNHKLMFRIRVSAPNTGGSGNTRYDNITVEGDSIGGGTATGIKQASMNAQGYALYPNPSTDFIQISSPFEGTKHVILSDMTGRTLLISDLEEKSPLDISALKAGIYFVRIYESNDVNNTTLRFIKN